MHSAASGLTLPERKRLELARALATEPRLLLLDEVMAGLNPTEIGAIVALIAGINARGVSILLIEHNMRAVMSLSHRIVVLSFGEKIAEGPPAAVATTRRWSRPTSARRMSTLLRLEGVEAAYGDLVAVADVSLEVRQGEMVALIGGNGAGKTTTLRAISGLLPVRRGVDRARRRAPRRAAGRRRSSRAASPTSPRAASSSRP